MSLTTARPAQGKTRSAGTPTRGSIVRDTLFDVVGIVASSHENEFGSFVGVYYTEIDDLVYYALPGYAGEALRYTTDQLEPLDHDSYVEGCDWFVIRQARRALRGWLLTHPRRGEDPS